MNKYTTIMSPNNLDNNTKITITRELEQNIRIILESSIFTWYYASKADISSMFVHFEGGKLKQKNTESLNKSKEIDKAKQINYYIDEELTTNYFIKNKFYSPYNIKNIYSKYMAQKTSDVSTKSSRKLSTENIKHISSNINLITGKSKVETNTEAEMIDISHVSQNNITHVEESLILSFFKENKDNNTNIVKSHRGEKNIFSKTPLNINEKTKERNSPLIDNNNKLHYNQRTSSINTYVNMDMENYDLIQGSERELNRKNKHEILKANTRIILGEPASNTNSSSKYANPLKISSKGLTTSTNFKPSNAGNILVGQMNHIIEKKEISRKEENVISPVEEILIRNSSVVRPNKLAKTTSDYLYTDPGNNPVINLKKKFAFRDSKPNLKSSDSTKFNKNLTQYEGQTNIQSNYSTSNRLYYKPKEVQSIKFSTQSKNHNKLYSKASINSIYADSKSDAIAQSKDFVENNYKHTIPNQYQTTSPTNTEGYEKLGVLKLNSDSSKGISGSNNISSKFGFNSGLLHSGVASKGYGVSSISAKNSSSINKTSAIRNEPLIITTNKGKSKGINK
jgi:hypothetical protein